MSEICPICGLPKDICVCEEVAKEQQQIVIRVVRRRYGKEVTIIEGIDGSEINLEELAKFAENINYSEENLESNINLLNFYIELSDKLDCKGIYFSKIKEIIDKKILPSVVPFRGKMLLMHDNREYLYSTFNAGILILKFLNLPGIQVKNKNMYFSIARKLITSSLSFADSSGMLPASIYKNKYSGYLAPEKLKLSYINLAFL